MKVLIYTCLDIFNINPIYIETLQMCLKELFKTQDYEFDYMLNVGYGDIRIYKNALAKYRNKIIFKQHKDFEYYNKYKDILNRKYMIWYSKVFMAREIKGYDVLIHNDYDNIALKSYKPLIDITCNYDVVCNKDNYGQILRIGTECILYNSNNTYKLKIEDLKEFNGLSEEELLRKLQFNVFNIQETKFGMGYQNWLHLHIHPTYYKMCDIPFLKFSLSKLKEINPHYSLIKPLENYLLNVKT